MAKARGGVKARQVAASKETEILHAVADLDMEGVNSTIGETQIEVQKTLADLSAKLLEKLQILRQIEDAIQYKSDDLKRHHDIEAKVTELDELEAQIEQRKREWEEEQARKRREFEEQRSERAKAWQREEQEYDYQKRIERRQKEDEFAQAMIQRERENRDKQEQLDKNWAEREGELAKHEAELVELREKVTGMPEAIKKAENAASQIAANSVKKEYETKAQLAQKDAETIQKLAAQEIGSLQATITKLNTQIEEMRRDLSQAHHDAKDISAKALDSAAGRSAMEALQRVLEKEPGQKQQK
jgi:chromosome segregation ATPase